MITGIVSSAKNSTPRNRAYVAMPITIRRQAQAAARSSPHGTWAGAKFEGPVSIAGCARGGVRRLSHWWARRPARRSPAPSSPGASGAVEASLLTGLNLRDLCPGQSADETAGRVGMLAGQQAHGREHVVDVDGDLRASRELPTALDIRADAPGEDPLGDPGAAVPEYAARADQEVDLAEVLAGPLDHASLGADHDLATPGVAAQGETDGLAGELLVDVGLGVVDGDEAGVLPAPERSSLRDPRDQPPRRW